MQTNYNNEEEIIQIPYNINNTLIKEDDIKYNFIFFIFNLIIIICYLIIFILMIQKIE